MSHAAAVSGILLNVPRDPCQTRWNSWYENCKWLNENQGALKAFVTNELTNGSTNTQMIEIKQMVEKDFPILSHLRFSFLVHCGKPIFDLIHNVEVGVAPTWACEGAPLQPHMHRVYNQLQKLHVC